MKYEIAFSSLLYRGIERSLTVSSFDIKNNFNRVLDKYFEYLSILDLPVCKDNFERIIECYHFFLENNVKCEMIVYDNTPFESAYGYKVGFLGIDVVCDMCESLIFESASNEFVKKLTNQNGLCDDIRDVATIISGTSQQDFVWRPCWVYKVIC